MGLPVSIVTPPAARPLSVSALTLPFSSASETVIVRGMFSALALSVCCNVSPGLSPGSAQALHTWQASYNGLSTDCSCVVEHLRLKHAVVIVSASREVNHFNRHRQWNRVFFAPAVFLRVTLINRNLWELRPCTRKRVNAFPPLSANRWPCVERCVYRFLCHDKAPCVSGVFVAFVNDVGVSRVQRGRKQRVIRNVAVAGFMDG